MKAFLTKAQQWHPTERGLFVAGSVSMLALLILLLVFEASKHSKWFEISTDVNTQYVPPPDAYTKIASNPPQYAAPYSYMHINGYYDTRCQEKLPKPPQTPMNPFGAITIPDQKCVLVEYSDIEISGYKTEWNWNFSPLWRNIFFRSSFIIFCISWSVFFLFGRILLPLFRWIKGR